MARHTPVLPSIFVLAGLFLALQTTGCGTSDHNRVLQSITVAPSTAEAQNFANGQVQFIATGNFSKPPSPAPVPFVAPYSGGWRISDPTIATISQSGVAQCASGASGVVTVTATASANSCPPDLGKGCMSIAVLGTAKLTCP